jgi:predicted membrane-bound dolichyl-phosphate-mannose-protein mannosyltransferase
MNYMQSGSNKRGKLSKAKLFIELVIIIAIVSYYTGYQVNYASSIDDYISDECWYVTSARNILVKVFNMEPRQTNSTYYAATLEYNEEENKAQISRYVINLGGKIIKSNYKEIQVLYVIVPIENSTKLKEIPNVVRVVPGYWYPDKSGILDYLNTEHPPLAKYIIALSMLVCGDNPVCWRLPSIILSAFILIIEYMIIRFITRNFVGGLLGCVAAGITALDLLFRSMGLVAMLDIYVAFFTILALYLFLKNRLTISSAILGLSFMSKYSGVFPALPMIYLGFKKFKPARVLLNVIYIPLLLLFIVSLPMISYLGLLHWWGVSVEGAVRWHLSIKTTDGPPVAAPWDWLIGRNPFILHFAWDQESSQWVADLMARGNAVLYMIALALTVFILPGLRKLPDRGEVITYTWGTFLMYIVIWLLGSKTQYSFYMVQITPLLYTSLLIIIYYLTNPVANVMKIARTWWRILTALWKWLGGEARIRIHIEAEECQVEKSNAEESIEEQPSASEDADSVKEASIE